MMGRQTNPSWTTEELVQELRRRGIVGPGDTVAFYKPDRDGEVPINSYTVQDLLTLQKNTGIIPIIERSVYH